MNDRDYPPHLDRHHIGIGARIGDSLPAVMVDLLQIEQVLLNLETRLKQGEVGAPGTTHKRHTRIVNFKRKHPIAHAHNASAAWASQSAEACDR